MKGSTLGFGGRRSRSDDAEVRFGGLAEASFRREGFLNVSSRTSRRHASQFARNVIRQLLHLFITTNWPPLLLYGRHANALRTVMMAVCNVYKPCSERPIRLNSTPL